MDYASYYENNLPKKKSAIYYKYSDNAGINCLVKILNAVKNKGNPYKTKENSKYLVNMCLS